MSDPRWFDYAAPLYEFLAQPRDWVALDSWGQMGKTRLRNCLAWLELNGRATSGWTADGKVYWVQVGLDPPGSRKRAKLPAESATEPGGPSDQEGDDGDEDQSQD